VQYEPKGLDLLFFLSGLGIEYDDEGIRLSQKAMRWRAMLEAVISDSRKHRETLPSELLKVFGILFLLRLDESGFISFPYESTSKWQELWQAFCLFAERLDDILILRKKRGAPTSLDAIAINSFVTVCRNLDKVGYMGNKKAGQYWGYLWLLFVALKARLEKSEDFTKRKTAFERDKAIERELKAAKTAVDRSWRRLYQDEPPEIETEDKQEIKAWIVGDFSQTQKFIERFKAKFGF